MAARERRDRRRKDRIAEKDREIATLKERLARAQDGSMFDLERDTLADIATTIVKKVSLSRATGLNKALAKAIKDEFKAVAKPAG